MDTVSDPADGLETVGNIDPARLLAELDRAAMADPLAIADARALIADPLAAHLGNQLRRLAAWNLALTDLQLRRAAREGKVLA